MNPYLNKVSKGDHGTRAEKKLAKRLGARLQPGSGNMEGAKGDMRLSNIAVESKSTVNESISLKYDWLKKISKEALDVNSVPGLAIQFVDGNGNPRSDGSWVMIPETMFNELVDRIK